MRPAHQFYGGFDMPPGFGLLAVALLFEGRSLLRGLGDGRRAASSNCRA
jgi:hypothetical protein